MSDRKRQQRAAMIVGGAAAGGLAIIGLAVALASGGGGDDTNAIDTSRTTTSSSSTTSSSTSTSTSTTTTMIVIPTAPPPTAIVIPTAPPTAPPTSPPTSPTTSPPTTDPPTTTTTLPANKQLALQLDTALNGGVPPAPGDERVTVKTLSNSKAVDVTWKLDAPLPPDEQAYQAREEAFLLLQTIQAANPPGNDGMRIKATIPKPGNDRVILLVIDRSEFDTFDFGSVSDPLTVFELPFITSKDINDTYVPDPSGGPTTSTSTSTSTSTTTTTT